MGMNEPSREQYPCCDHCRSEEGGCDWFDRHHAPCGLCPVTGRSRSPLTTAELLALTEALWRDPYIEKQVTAGGGGFGGLMGALRRADTEVTTPARTQA